MNSDRLNIFEWVYNKYITLYSIITIYRLYRKHIYFRVDIKVKNDGFYL